MNKKRLDFKNKIDKYYANSKVDRAALKCNISRAQTVGGDLKSDSFLKCSTSPAFLKFTKGKSL